MKERKDIWDELENQPSNPPFKVPDGYFNTLEERIEAKIKEEAEPVSSKGKIIRMLKPALAMAASFALVFLLVYYPLSVFLPAYLAKNADTPLEQNQPESEEDILFSYLSISAYSAYDLLGSENGEESTKQVSDEEVLDYLTVSMNETEIYAELKN